MNLICNGNIPESSGPDGSSVRSYQNLKIKKYQSYTKLFQKPYDWWYQELVSTLPKKIISQYSLRI